LLSGQLLGLHDGSGRGKHNLGLKKKYHPILNATIVTVPQGATDDNSPLLEEGLPYKVLAAALQKLRG
jgi:hypothetical protein